MKRKILFVVILLSVISSFVMAEALFFGTGPEGGAFTRSGGAIGGGVFLGGEINNQFAIGVKTGFLHDFDDINSLNIQGFVRYQLPLPVDGFFVRADAGVLMLFYDGETFPVFSGGLAAGWRYNFSQNWFLEPALRFGYPYMWGASLVLGFRFSPRINNSYSNSHNNSYDNSYIEYEEQ